MPELPEVETIRLGLEKYLVGRVIKDIEIRFPKIISGNVEKCIGVQIKKVRRLGKGLVIDFDNKYSLVAHVKMTGQFIYRGREVKSKIISIKKTGDIIPGKHTHLIFKLKSNNEKEKNVDFLYYNDIRKFGWLKVIPTSEVENLNFFKSLGPEPLKNLSLIIFKEIIKKSNLQIKSLLLDQKKIAGVGNIYANDALYLSRINPTLKSSELTDLQIEVLLQSLEIVLKKGLEVGGASERNYVNALGEAGNYQKFFQVYGKKGNKCKRCGSIIEKIMISGRGTFFCPTCQK